MKNKKSLFSPIKAWKYLIKQPITVPMEDIIKKPREASDRYRGFHTNNWDKCIGCGTCSEICPTNAIKMLEFKELPDKDGSKPERPAIDYGRCCFCGMCVDICTSGSLGMTKEYLHLSKDPETFFFIPEKDGIHKSPAPAGYNRDEKSELLELKRVGMEGRDPEDRKGSFIEIVKGFSKEQAQAEAARCVECGICTKTCPAHMNIPEYIRAIWEGDMESALDYIYRTNPLPGVCGRVCTHKCETACSLKNRGEAISIRWLKRYIVDNSPDDLYEKTVLAAVSKKADGKIAVIGAGPSGLSAAYYLGTLGYEVDIYEAMPLAGGIMRYGIPRYRLPDEALDRDISFIEKLGVRIHTGTKAGADITLDKMKEKYDAVYASTGFFTARGMNIPGSDHKDVTLALDFLIKARDYARGSIDMPDIHEKVIVVGGGNVAFDVARSIARLQNIKYGKTGVNMIALEEREVLPADREELEEALEEGIVVTCGCGPQNISVNSENGAITGVITCKCTSLFDENKRFNPQFDYSTKSLVEGTQVFLAIGQMPDYSYIPEGLKESIEIQRGKILTEESGQVKGIPWLFAGGDILHGPDIIHAVADGHKAAKGIDGYLTK